ncbi:hypothetical protein BYT27DRAFT_6948514 [Phlegmacium glaucopus]|nr:hypothetical protein BYT27DRAFT_6948514 [Phlegmacium glaucopus]
MNANRTESAPLTPLHDCYIPWIDPVPRAHVIDGTNWTIDDFPYDPPSPIDLDALARDCDPRGMYPREVRKITMDSLVKNARIVGGPHCLPPKPILYMDIQAREMALNPDGTQHKAPSGIRSWYYRADMAQPPPIPPIASIIRSKIPLPDSGIGIDPLETLGGTPPARRRNLETKPKRGRKRFDPIQVNTSPKKRNRN